MVTRLLLQGGSDAVLQGKHVRRILQLRQGCLGVAQVGQGGDEIVQRERPLVLQHRLLVQPAQLPRREEGGPPAWTTSHNAVGASMISLAAK